MWLKRLLLPISLLIIGCGMSEHGTYPLSQVEVENVERSANEVIVKYRALLESAYYSPGVRIEEKDGERLVTVVRCPIDGECSTDIAGVQEDSAMVVRIPKTGGPLFLYDGEHKQGIE